MTISAEPARPTGLRARWIAVVLALSVVLNICFVAGALMWPRLMPLPNAGERFVGIAKSLDLNPNQKRAFQDFHRTLQQRGKQMHDTIEPLIQQIWDEEAKPQPDQTHISELITQASHERREFQDVAATALTGFLAQLTPDQRAKFVAEAQHHQDQVGRRIWQMIVP